MKIHFLNCFSCDARIPADLRTGTLCLLIETDSQDLILVDTGPGLGDYVRKPLIMRAFQIVTKVPLDPEESAIRQVLRLGYEPERVKDIVLTHMHFDHCGGLADFPQATVHVHEIEYQAFNSFPRQWTDFAYVRRHLTKQQAIRRYRLGEEVWFDFPAIRLPLSPEMWLIPLAGHSRGHCALALRLNGDWLFHLADAAAFRLTENIPNWLVRFVLGPHGPRLRQFTDRHPEMLVTTGHMPIEFFNREPLESASESAGASVSG